MVRSRGRNPDNPPSYTVHPPADSGHIPGPPSYQSYQSSVNPQYHHHESRNQRVRQPPNYATMERTPLIISVNPPSIQLRREKSRFSCGLLILRAMLLIAVVTSTAAAMYFKLQRDEAILPENVRLRRQLWNKERLEHERLEGLWISDHKRYLEDRTKWEAQRKAEEQRRKENERRRVGIYWDQPSAHQCAAYGVRPYTSKLINIPSGFDGLEACGEMPFVFHNRTVEKPLRCEKRLNGEIYGHWMVDFDEPLCQPHWANPNDKGCVGYRSGLHRWEARLWGIHDGDSWFTMCSTAPNTIGGYHFKTPTHCDHRGSVHGVVGIFEAPDPNCA